MASRISEVIYKLKDLFTGPAKRIGDGYERIRGESRKTASAIERDSTRMGRSLNVVAGRIKALVGVFAAGFAGRAAVGGISEIADELDRLGKVADRLDIDPGALAALEFTAERAGLSINKMTSAIETLQKRTGEALQGIGRARYAFDALGISAAEFADLNAEQQLIAIADALQSVASEEERAAIAAQLFSKANADLLQVLNQGGPALARQIAQGREYRNVTEEATQAAAKYNDALTDLQAKIDGLKFRKLTPVISGLTSFFDSAGFGDYVNSIDAIEARLDTLRNKLNQTFLPYRGARRGELLAEYSKLEAQLKLLRDEEAKASAATTKAAKDRAAAAQDTTVYTEAIEEVNDALQAQADGQAAVLQTQTAELRAARAEQANIEREFAQLVDDIAAQPAADVSLADVFYADTKARAALARGDIEDAIAFARQGADLLGALKDKGSETQGTLNFLAEQLRKVAAEASAQQVEAELIDVEQAQQGLDELERRFDAFKVAAEQKGKETGQAFMAALRAELAGADLAAGIGDRLASLPAQVREQMTEINAELASAGRQGAADYTAALAAGLNTEVEPPTVRAPRVIRDGNSFSDGTDFRAALDKRGGK